MNGNSLKDKLIPTTKRVYSIKNHGTTIWYMGEQIHRNNGLPAVEYTNEDIGEPHEPREAHLVNLVVAREWWVNGMLHRDNNLPAIERADGRLEWWEHGKLIKSTESTFPIV